MAKVVVVDDMKVMRLFLRRALERIGHEVVEWDPPAATEVADRLQADPPDLLITDHAMPGCNGATLTRMAKRARPDLPVIMVTSSRDEEVVASSRKMGVDLVLHKPLPAEDLQREVAQILTRGTEGTVALKREAGPG